MGKRIKGYLSSQLQTEQLLRAGMNIRGKQAFLKSIFKQELVVLHT